MIENLQRQDLHPVDEARQIKHLKETGGYSDEILGRMLGLARSTITQRAGIAELPDAILDDALAQSLRPSRDGLIAVKQAGDEEQQSRAWQEIKGGATRVTLRAAKSTPVKRDTGNFLIESLKSAKVIDKHLEGVDASTFTKRDVNRLDKLSGHLIAGLVRIIMIETALASAKVPAPMSAGGHGFDDDAAKSE